jgi:hypothetical protein
VILSTRLEGLDLTAPTQALGTSFWYTEPLDYLFLPIRNILSPQLKMMLSEVEEIIGRIISADEWNSL